MFKSRSTKIRNIVLAAAALVTLGTAALSSTEASAFGYRFHHYHFNHYRSHWSHWSHYRTHWHYRWNYRRFAYNHYSYRWPWRHTYGRSYYRGPAFGASGPAPVQASAPGPAPAQMMGPAAARPACLAKQYTPDGAVVFVDRCTQESAISPPPGAPPAGGQGPQQ